MKKKFLFVLFLVYLMCFRAQSNSNPDPSCVPTDLVEKCKEAKCKNLNIKNCKSVVDPYPGGDQCCDSKTLSAFGSSRVKRQSFNFDAHPSAKWDPIIKFYLNFSDNMIEENIRKAMLVIEKSTCVEFVKSSFLPKEPFLLFKLSNKGCFSFVGKSESEATPIVGNWECFSKPGNILHFLAQTLGLWHQTQRKDIAEHVTINKENLLEKNQADFIPVEDFYISSKFNISYDYSSIMHYPAKIFSSNSKPTLKPKDPLYLKTMGQRVELSFNDIKLINNLYCPQECEGGVVCLNGGYPRPGDCGACVCPEGFNGTTCQLEVFNKTDTCGGEVQVSGKVDFLSHGHISNFWSSKAEEDLHCEWKLTTGPNMNGTIQLKFLNSFYLREENGVCEDWVEIRYKEPLTQLGPRFCGTNLPSLTINSSSDVLVIFKTHSLNIKSSSHFVLGHRLVNVTHPCSSGPCKNNGSCVILEDKFKCFCTSNFSGETCETNLAASSNSCSLNPCRNNGTCSYINNTFSCQCLSGFWGDRCQYADCGGCRSGFNWGCKDQKCKIPFEPQKICNKTVVKYHCDWFGCHLNTENVTFPCIKSTMCCDNAFEKDHICHKLGWSDWSYCSRRCGKGTSTRFFYGVQQGEFILIEKEMRSCKLRECMRNPFNRYLFNYDSDYYY